MDKHVYLKACNVTTIDINTLQYTSITNGFVLSCGTYSILQEINLSRNDFILLCKKDPLSIILTTFENKKHTSFFLEMAIVTGGIFYNGELYKLSNIKGVLECRL